MNLRVLVLLIVTWNCSYGYSQTACSNYIVDFPNDAIIGSIIQIKVKSYEPFKIVFPENNNFELINIDSLSVLYGSPQKMYNGVVKTNIEHITKTIRIRCKKTGKSTIPSIVIKFNDYQCLTEKYTIDVFETNEIQVHEIDSVSMFPKVNSISEIKKGVDFFVIAEIEKNKIKLGDSLLVRFNVHYGLANNFDIKGFYSKDSIIIKRVSKNDNEITNNGIIRVKGRNYQSFLLPKVYLFFDKVGEYNLDNFIFDGEMIFTKIKKGDAIDDFFGLNRENTNYKIEMPVINRTIKVEK